MGKKQPTIQMCETVSCWKLDLEGLTLRRALKVIRATGKNHVAKPSATLKAMLGDGTVLVVEGQTILLKTVERNGDDWTYKVKKRYNW